MKDILQSSLKEALKAKDNIKRDTIRAILSCIQYAEMESDSGSVSEAQCISIAKSEIKKRNEEIEFAEKAGKADYVEQLKKEQEIILNFLPAQLTEEQLKEKISSIVAELDTPNIGLVMKSLKENFDGQYDGKLASQLIKTLL